MLWKEIRDPMFVRRHIEDFAFIIFVFILWERNSVHFLTSGKELVKSERLELNMQKNKTKQKKRKEKKSW